MSLTNPELPVTEVRLQEFYERIKPYLGGGYSAGDGIEISNGEISTDNLQSGDMDDVVTPIPSIPTRVPHKYSTTEQIVGEWIDGRTIYEKTFVITLTGSSQWQSVAHGISNIKDVISRVGWTSRSGEYYYIPYSTHQTTQMISTTSDATNIYILAVDRANDKAYITMQYTKTTD